MYEDVATDAIINKFAIDIAKGPVYVIYVPEGTIRGEFVLDAE